MAPRSTTKTTAKASAKPKAKTAAKSGEADIDALVAEITEVASLIGHHVPKAVEALTSLRNLLVHLADAGDGDTEADDVDADEDGDEDEAPVTASKKGGKKNPDPVDEDEDEGDEGDEGDEDDEDEGDEALSALPDFDNPKEIVAFLAERGIDMDDYNIPAKGPKRMSEATSLVENLAAIIEAAEGDKLVLKGKKTVIEKLVETLDEAGGAVKRLKKHDDRTYAWLVAAAILEAEGEAEDGDEDEDE